MVLLCLTSCQFELTHAFGLKDVNGTRRRAAYEVDAAERREMQRNVLFGVVALEDLFHASLKGVELFSHFRWVGRFTYFSLVNAL